MGCMPWREIKHGVLPLGLEADSYQSIVFENKQEQTPMHTLLVEYEAYN